MSQRQTPLSADAAPTSSTPTGSSRPGSWRCSASPARCSSRSPPRRSCWRSPSSAGSALIVDRAASASRCRASSGRCSSTPALTLVSAAFSPQPRASLVDSKQLVLFLIVPLAYRFASGTRGRTLIDRDRVGRRGERGVRHRPVRHPALRPARPAAAGHARALHDLLGAADAGHRRRRWRASCSARASASGRRWSCRRWSSPSR